MLNIATDEDGGVVTVHLDEDNVYSRFWRTGREAGTISPNIVLDVPGITPFASGLFIREDDIDMYNRIEKVHQDTEGVGGVLITGQPGNGTQAPCFNRFSNTILKGRHANFMFCCFAI
jgi:hypothetical protein